MGVNLEERQQLRSCLPDEAAGCCGERPSTPRKDGRGARRSRLERIRKEIENGTYETEGKLRIAISRLIDDVLTRRDKKRQ